MRCHFFSPVPVSTSTQNGTSTHALFFHSIGEIFAGVFALFLSVTRPFDSRTGTDHVTFVTRGRTKPGHGEIAPDGR